MNEASSDQAVGRPSPEPVSNSVQTAVAPSGTPESKCRPKSQLRLQLEAMEPGQEITVSYSDMKTPFSILMAIKRQQLGKHFVFREVAPGQYRIWMGSAAERSRSIRKKASTTRPSV